MNTYVENINDIIHETSVDFVTRPCSREIHIVQYDKGLPVIKVNLFREGQPYQLPNSASVHVRLGKLDNTFVYTNILGMNEDRTIAYFEVTEQMAMISGRVNPVIEVVYQGKVACSSPIPFVISKNPVQEGQIESHDEFPIIYQLESDVEEHNEWIRKYTALTEFDGFVKGESVWDGIAEGEIKYCQSGSQTEDVPGENTVIKIDLSQQHLSKSESKALYIKKIVINYTPDGQTEKTYEYTFNSRIFGSGTSLPTIEPEYADLTDVNSGITLRWYLNYLLQEGVSQYFGNYNGTKGQQFGSNNNPPALISLSTSSLENCTVNSIYVEVSSNGGTQAKCKLTIVNDVWTCNNIQDPQITSNNAQYKWLHEPNGTHLGFSSGGQVIHHYNHVFLKKENGKVTEVQPDPALQYVLNDYSSTYKYSTADNLLHQIVSSFEVLSKIEFTHDIHNNITVLRFPKNIMPSVMYNDSMGNYLYFDYINNKVLNYEGKNIIDPNHQGMWMDNGCLTVSLIGDWIVEPEYDFIKYDVYDGGYDNPLRHTILMTNNWEKYHKKGSFKQGIGLKDISFKYTYMYYDGGEIDYTQPSPSRNAWHITKMGYLDGIPALFNPSPDGNTTYDVWYKYCGKKYINGKQYDGWTEPYVGDVVYIHYSEIIVDDTDFNTILESKEILRSVEYIRDVNNSDSIIGYKFPKNIAPHRLYNNPYGMTFYFDYDTGIILDESKTNVGNITITEDERVLLNFSQTGAYAIIGPIDFDYDSLEYGYFEKDEKINTYNLYKGGGTEVSKTIFNYSYQEIQAIKIGDTSYNLVRSGIYNYDSRVSMLIGNVEATGNASNSVVITSGNLSNTFNIRNQNCVVIGIGANPSMVTDASSNNTIVIGYNATANKGSNNVIIGSTASAYNSHNVVIGDLASVGHSSGVNQYSVAIGAESVCKSSDTVSFDKSSGGRTITLYDATKIYLRFGNMPTSQLLTTNQGHYMSEFIQEINNLYKDSNGKWWRTANFSSGFTGNYIINVNSVTINVKYHGLTDYGVFSLSLVPYDSNNNIGYTSYTRIAIDGTAYDITATIDSSGAVVFSCSNTDLSIDQVRYTIK